MNTLIRKISNLNKLDLKFCIDEFESKTILGWVHTANNNSVTLSLEVDGTKVLNVKANDYRVDLEQAGKVHGKCAFSIKISEYLQVNAIQKIRVIAHYKKRNKIIFDKTILVGDILSEVEVPMIKFKSYLQKVEDEKVSGWVSFGTTQNKISLDAFIDGKLIGRYLTNGTRKDLVDSGVAGKNVAFSFTIPEKYWDSSKHSLEVKVTGTGEHLSGSAKEFFIKKSLLNKVKEKPVKQIKSASFKGAVDKLRNGKVVCGWATDFINKSVPIEVLIDGKVVGDTVAGGFRADLKDANINEGYAAFEFMPSANIFDGKKHIISIRDKSSKTVIATREDVELKNDRNYKDYHEYLRWSYFNKEIYAPFAEEDKRCLSYMDWFVKRDRLEYLDVESSGKSPLVSIIMPTYKRAEVILTAVESVLSQTYKNWELVVVDDGGKDNTGEVLSSLQDSRIKFFELPENKGVSTARNKALELSSGKYICYLDSDNTWHEDFLLIMQGNLQKNTGFDTAYCAQYLFKGQIKTPYAMRYGMFNKTLLKNRNYIDMNCLMHKRSVYTEKGGFDTSLRRLVDWDLLLRYTEDKAPLTVPAILSNYYFNEGEETITVSESLSDAIEGLIEKDVTYNKVDVLNHAEISFSSDGGSDESILTGVPFYSSVINNKKNIASKLTQHRKCAIVVVSFNIPGIFKKCLDSMIDTVDLTKTEIIIIDNLSNDETIALLHEYNDRYPQIKLKLNNYNFGFTHAVNQGIAMADDDADIVLINNDSIATPGWLNAMEDVVVNNPDVGIVAPQQVLLPNTKTMNQHSPFANAGNELDVTVSYHHDNLVKTEQSPSHLIDVHFIPFFCVYIPRDTINEVGVLDAELGRHYRSDRLYCNAVIQFAKKRIVFTPASKLYHLHQQSTSSLKKKNDKVYQEMFTENKWSDNELYKTPIWEE
jgi:glycosyltransferase involved in cell wall biosynthesis